MTIENGDSSTVVTDVEPDLVASYLEDCTVDTDLSTTVTVFEQ